MIKVTKDGITKFITEHELQDYKDMGFLPENHKPEPMVIKEPTQKQNAKKAEI